MKKQNGITLIALVITIIVLLILAGVSINSAVGNNGIIAKAKKAALETRAANIETEFELWKINNSLAEHTKDGNTQDLDDILDSLLDKNLITPEEKDEIKNNGKIQIGDSVIVFEPPSISLDCDEKIALITGNSRNNKCNYEKF